MQDITYSELEQEVQRLVTALRTRNFTIGRAIINDLRDQFLLQDVAGIVLVSVERVLWIDAQSFCWAIESLIPSDIMQEIRRIMSMQACQRLIGKGLVLGRDFSIDARGNLLLGEQAKTSVFS